MEYGCAAVRASLMSMGGCVNGRLEPPADADGFGAGATPVSMRTAVRKVAGRFEGLDKPVEISFGVTLARVVVVVPPPNHPHPPSKGGVVFAPPAPSFVPF